MFAILQWILALSYCAGQLGSIRVLRKRIAQARSLNSTRQKLDTYPGVSILTSLKGPTPGMTESLRSLAQQNYSGPIEFVIAVKDSNEPLLKEAQDFFHSEFPRTRVKWIYPVDTARKNPRTAKIARAAQEATYDWLFVTCVDTRFELNHLQSAFELNRKQEDKFVTSYPIIDDPRNWAARLEAIGLNLDVMQFFMYSSVFRDRPMAYGGSLLFSKGLLKKCGGFEQIIPLLTDDITLARAFIRVGGKPLLSPTPARVRLREHSFEEFWKRQVRWRMIGKYFLPELFQFAPFTGVPHALLLLGVSTFVLNGVSTKVLNDSILSMTLLQAGFVCLGVRVLTALLNQAYHGTPKREWTSAWLVPIYDGFALASWIVARRTNRVKWGEQTLTLDPHGAVIESKIAK